MVSPSTRGDPTLNKVTILAPVRRHKSTQELNDLGRFCKELTIRVELDVPTFSELPERSLLGWRRGSASSAGSSHERSARQVWSDMRRALRAGRDSLRSELSVPVTLSAVIEEQTNSRESRNLIVDTWTRILSHFPSIDTITISVQDREPWPTNGLVEDTLIAVRVALEECRLPYLQRLRCQPVHAMGIVTFRWHGFGAIARAPAAAYSLWEAITRLDLQVHNPLGTMSDSQRLVFLKLLHDYLGSFAPTVQQLRFIWLEGDGPSPMALQQEPGMVGFREVIHWHSLGELWMGNVLSLGRAIAQAKEHAPNLKRMKTLRAPVQDDSKIFEEASAWVVILLDPQEDAMPAADRESLTLHSMAVSGQTLPFMLDSPPASSNH